MKKLTIYINSKQATLILIPLILIIMVFLETELLVGDLKRLLTFKDDNFRISKEVIFQNLLNNRDRVDLYEKSFFDIDKNSTIWLLKYAIFKEEEVHEKGKLTTYFALTKKSSEDNSNEMLESLSKRSLENLDKETFFANLEKKVSKKEIEIKKQSIESFKLQMILISNKKSKVIINGKILAIGDKIGEAKLIKIDKDRVFIKTPKESKWLKLIN